MKKLFIFVLLISLNISSAHGGNITETLPSESTIESNFYNLTIKKYKIGSPSSPLVFASLPNHQNIVIADRQLSSGELSVYKLDNSRLINIKKFNLSHNGEGKIYVLDMLADQNSLWVSYVNYYNTQNACDQVLIAQFRLENQNNIAEDSQKTIFRSKPCLSWPNAIERNWSDTAGRLALSKQGLFISLGLIISDAYSNNYPNPGILNLPKNFSEISKTTSFGAVSRIDLQTGKTVVFAKGFRGPQGLYFDSNRNILWASDHGPRGGDELDKVVYQKDFGWPYVSYGRPYEIGNEGKIPTNTFSTKYSSHEGFQKPTWVWLPSIAPSQLTSVGFKSNFSKNWNGDLIVSSLKTKSIFRIKLDINAIPIYIEQIEIGHRIRDLESNGKSLLMTTDDGYIIELDTSNSVPQKVYPPLS
jgi:glucose/arabinose dehydrogenase